MKKNYIITLRTILIHTCFWIAVWFLYYYFFSYNSSDKEYVIWFSSLLLPLTMALTYFLISFLIPRYLLTKKYFHFSLYSFYTLLVTSYIIVLIIYGCLFILKKMDATNIPPMLKNFVFILVLVFLVSGMVSFVSILNSTYKTQKKNKELQNRILSAQLQIKEQELQYLKNQIHPHFLFNTLNTIYGFALKQSKQTPDIILKLSNLLDYILYQVNKPQVLLSDEIKHIREYIELERIRFQESLKVNFRSSGCDHELYIAPMLLIPFVENAFKHGSIIEDYLHVEISITCSNNELFFFSKNTVKASQHKHTGGIGLENIKKRLELNYSGKYEMSSEIKGNWYEVTLTIKDLSDEL